MTLPLVERVQGSEEGALDGRRHLSQLLSPETVLEAQSLSSPSEVRFQTHAGTSESSLCQLRKIQWEHSTAATGAGVEELAGGPH